MVNDATDVVVATDTTDAVAVFTEIPVGTYYAMVTDSIGCEDESDTTVTITSPAEVKFDIRITSYNVCYTKVLRSFKKANLRLRHQQVSGEYQQYQIREEAPEGCHQLKPCRFSMH